MKISITEADIEQAASDFSPIAVAFARRFGPDKVITEPTMVGYYHGYGRVAQFLLPKEAMDFVERFNRGEDVEPFEFEVGVQIYVPERGWVDEG